MTLVLLYTTFPDRPSAIATCHSLLENKEIACANIGSGVLSLYEWKGDLVQNEEIPVLLKTAKEHLSQTLASLRKAHPYETPALLCWDVDHCDPDYERWLKQQLMLSSGKTDAPVSGGHDGL